MKKNTFNLSLLYAIFCSALVISNAIASKLFDTGLMLFGSPVTFTVGAICYPITFLVTDIIGEKFGKKEANTAVVLGFICQIISVIVIAIARALPATDPSMQEAFDALMGSSWVFVTASLVAYLCSQKWDVFIFHKLRDRYIAKHGSTKGGRWIWNNASTMTSQLLDSIIYAVIAFGFGFRWLWDASMTQTLINMILAQWIFKSILALLDTPIFYFFTRKAKDEG